MKKITLCLLAIGCSLGVFAQKVIFTPVGTPEIPQTQGTTDDGKRLLPPSSGMSCFNQVVVNRLVIDSVTAGYATGTNLARDSKYAQIYKVLSGSGNCTGVVAKIGAGQAGDGEFKAELFSVSSGKPATSLGVSDPVDATTITATVQQPQEVSFSFPNPISINADFAAAIEIPDYFEDTENRIICMIQGTPQGCVWGSYTDLSCAYNSNGWKLMSSYTDVQSGSKVHMDLHIYAVVNSDDDIKTSIKEVNPLMLTASIYPNPANNAVTIVSLNKVERLEVYNAVGQMVYTESTNNLISNIDVSNLSTGNYVVKMQTEKGLISKKLVITK